MRDPTTGLAFVLIDGIGDVSIPELGNRTPLEAAHCPNLDAIAGSSSCTQHCVMQTTSPSDPASTNQAFRPRTPSLSGHHWQRLGGSTISTPSLRLKCSVRLTSASPRIQTYTRCTHRGVTLLADRQQRGGLQGREGQASRHLAGSFMAYIEMKPVPRE